MELEHTTEETSQRATNLTNDEVKAVIELWSERESGAATGEPRATLRDLAETLGIPQTQAESLLREIRDRKAAEARAAEEADREQQAEIEREAMEHVRQSTIRRRELEAERLQLEEECRLLEQRRKLAETQARTSGQADLIPEERMVRQSPVIVSNGVDETFQTFLKAAVLFIAAFTFLFVIAGSRHYQGQAYEPQVIVSESTPAQAAVRPQTSYSYSTRFYGPFPGGKPYSIYVRPPATVNPPSPPITNRQPDAATIRLLEESVHHNR